MRRTGSNSIPSYSVSRFKPHLIFLAVGRYTPCSVVHVLAFMPTLLQQFRYPTCDDIVRTDIFRLLSIAFDSGKL